MATILIVEDRTIDRQFLVTLLGYGGHSMLEACNGIEARELVRNHKPDLVISDIVMPSMDGLELVRLLRSDPDTAQTSVIFYTATFRGEEASSLAEACGVKIVLEKPSEPEVILGAVAAALGQRNVPIVPLQGEAAEAFTREHVRLLTDKLVQKVRELEAVNADLDRRVRERTAELEAANKELEAFSYSISHDLRAPLRAIDGFACAVVEDWGPQLPKEAQQYLHSIREGARKMGALIEDLLAFSRSSRQPLEKRTVATEELVRAVWDELSPQREGRQVEFRVGKLPACEGDPALLKQVLSNLLSNALKYSRKRQPAVIEVGVGRTLPAEGATDSPHMGTRSAKSAVTFFVRDNGVGFDMRYASKLFGVFQRLHGADDFEGTGVGLAIVQRIAHRHGGEVWAEAVLDRGATFYFTL